MQIRSIPLPSGPADATDPAWSDLQALAALGNDIMFELEGDHDLARSPEQIHAAYADQRYEERLAWLAVEDDELVGFASLRMPRAETTGAAHCFVAVRTDRRRQGVATALFDALTERSVTAGRSSLQTMVIHSVDPRAPQHPAGTGRGGVPRADASTGFLLGRGFVLEQSYVGRALALPVDETRLGSLELSALPFASGYEVISWEAPTPSDLRPGLARLRQRMSTDAPSAELDVNEDPWDADRVEHAETGTLASGKRVLFSAAREQSSGELVAYTDIVLQPDPDVSPDQRDTLVLREHRGHRLGLLVKIANLHRLAAARPQARRIKTFNADENGPMRSINESLGFVPAMVSGVWQRRLHG